MQSFTRSQGLLILLFFVLFILLFIAPGPFPKKDDVTSKIDESSEKTTGISFLEYLEEKLNTREKTLLARQDSLLAGINDLERDYAIKDSLVNFWSELGRLDLSAYYLEQMAGLKDSADLFNQAGKRYRDAAFFSPDKDKNVLYNRAIGNFERALEIDSTLLSAKLNLGVSIVESGRQPMQGITLLREVVEKDPENKRAHFQLGYFSMQSGQFDKAISRFKKVLEIDPKAAEAYFYLGESYAAMGEYQQAIEFLEKFKEFTTDEIVIKELDKRIIELNKLAN